MVVDDSPDDTKLLLRTFAQLGVSNPIIAFDNADDALVYLQDSQKTRPALLLLDLKMPGTSGFSMFAKIKTNYEFRHLIVIVLTTSTDIQDVKLAYELGANSFLTKPFDLGEFRDMVSAFHHYWIVQNQPLPTLPATDADTPRS